MTLEEAVECVGCWLDDMVGVLPPRLLEALPLVLAAAKEPRVYALGEEERKVLETLYERLGGEDGRADERDALRSVLDGGLYGSTS